MPAAVDAIINTLVTGLIIAAITVAIGGIVAFGREESRLRREQHAHPRRPWEK